MRNKAIVTMNERRREHLRDEKQTTRFGCRLRGGKQDPPGLGTTPSQLRFGGRFINLSARSPTNTFDSQFCDYRRIFYLSVA